MDVESPAAGTVLGGSCVSAIRRIEKVDVHEQEFEDWVRAAINVVAAGVAKVYCMNTPPGKNPDPLNPC